MGEKTCWTKRLFAFPSGLSKNQLIRYNPVFQSPWLTNVTFNEWNVRKNPETSVHPAFILPGCVPALGSIRGNPGTIILVSGDLMEILAGPAVWVCSHPGRDTGIFWWKAFVNHPQLKNVSRINVNSKYERHFFIDRLFSYSKCMFHILAYLNYIVL